MLYLGLLSVLIACAYIFGFYGKNMSSKWMSYEFTTAVRGWAILTVLWAHWGGTQFVGGIQFIAGIGVALFLVLSGFGLERSYQVKGLSQFWKKKILKILLPFWIIESIGLFVTSRITILDFMKDIFLINSATGYGWYMQYICICYIIFYIVKRIKQTYKMSDKCEMKLIAAIFLGWFLIEGIMCTTAVIPFLKCRQMMSFPCGMVIAKHHQLISEKLNGKAALVLAFTSGLLGTLMMAITQLSNVKAFPFVFSNSFSALTVFPLAISILLIGKIAPKLFENKLLLGMGKISYELYLVHIFLLKYAQPTVGSLISYIGISFVSAWILHKSLLYCYVKL